MKRKKKEYYLEYRVTVKTKDWKTLVPVEGEAGHYASLLLEACNIDYLKHMN